MSINQDNILTRALEKKISRRSFVKWSAALGATASMSGLVMQTGAKMATGAENVPAAGVGGSIVDWKPTCCLVCHSWCHVACGVDANGHVRKIEGAGGQPKKYSTGAPVKSYPVSAGTQQKPDDANHIATGSGFLAFAPHNKGRICAKGNDGVEHLYDPDRIKYPLRRVAGRGEGQWERLSWDEALTEIANVLRELAGVMTNVNGSANGGRGQDLRHRFVQYIGRNENAAPKNFTKAYGSPNHIEHTSLCELGRHVAGRTMWGHHWSSCDLQEHTDGFNIPWPWETSPTASLTLQSNLHDTDCYIEWGGNPCEAKIPHSTWATHFGDRRRRNLKGYTGGGRTGTVYGRIMCIDVRQSNTSAFADEAFNLVPGTDGALALAMMYYVLDAANGKGSTVVRQELDRGHMGGTDGRTDGDSGYDASNRLYYGLFAAEETGGIASGSATAAVPAGKSLETYLTGGEFATALGSANSWAGISGAVATLTGLSVGDISYLGSLFLNGNGGQFLNVVTDTYRGPVKHTNGVYNTRAIRALQILAPNYSAAQYGAARAAIVGGYTYVAPVTARGGYNAPGAFQSDKNWDPYNYGGGIAGTGGHPGATNNVRDHTAANGAVGAAGTPADQGMKLAGDNTSNRQRIDDWDYDYDVPRYRGAYKWVDQNLSPGIRHSVGIHAFVMGSPANAAIKGPYYYKDWRNKTLGTFDTSFKVEAVMIHKNAPGYARPQQNNEVDLLVAKDGTGAYRLKNFWAIDIAMGDGTRFADIILPDVTYLERYAERSGEGQEFNFRDNVYWRMPVFEVDGPTIDGKVCPRHLYDSKQVRAIYYELARKVEPGTAGNGGLAPWNGTLYSSFRITGGATPDLNSVALNISGGRAYNNDGEYAQKQFFELGCNNGAWNANAVTAGAADGADMIRSHAMLWNSNDRPAYWRPTSFRGDGETGVAGDTYAPGAGFKPDLTLNGHKLTVYNKRLDTTPDIVVNNADDGIGTAIVTHAATNGGYFDGRPIWIKPIQLETWSASGTYPLHLTTYKVNVHVQSRTTNLPRLAEILGNSWAVIHPDTANGTNPANATLAADPIANGDTILVSSETGGIEAVAKVSNKAQPGCVHISHSFGHRKGVMSVDNDEGISYRAAYGEYKVDGSMNRTLDNTLNNPAPSPADAWTLALPPTAPGKGTHCNIVITHHLNGDTGTGRNIATDAIGGDQAWFDTKVKVEKL